MAKRMRVSMGILCIVLTLLCLGGCDRDPEETEEVKEYYVFDPAVAWELRPLVTGDGVPLWYVANDMEYKPVDYAVTEDCGYTPRSIPASVPYDPPPETSGSQPVYLVRVKRFSA